MSLSKHIFGKPLYDLTLLDIEAFFQEQQQETSVLEFKTGDVSLEKIYREVAAFLNTQGGLLVIGAPQEQKQGDIKVCHGALTPTDRISSQDRLLQSIAGNISPAPVGLKATTLYSQGKNIFVVEIPQSPFAPHQVSDEGKYFIRLEREAKAAPHGIVEALFNQRKRSRLRAKVGPMVKGSPDRPSVYIFLENDSLIHAREVGFMLEIGGVRNLSNSFNFSDDVQVIDGVLKWHKSENGLLVKGMQYSVELDITLRMPLFYLHFAFYSADSSMEIIEFIFDTRSKTYLHRFYSQDEETQNSIIPQPFDTFRQMHRQFWADRLNIEYSEDEVKTVTERVYDFAATYKCKIPESLVDFFIITDGYDDIVNGRSIDILSIAGLEKSIKQENDLFEDNELVIGFLGDYPITLITNNYKSGTFKWVNQPTIFADPIEKESTCFYDVLEDFLTEA